MYTKTFQITLTTNEEVFIANFENYEAAWRSIRLEKESLGDFLLNLKDKGLIQEVFEEIKWESDDEFEVSLEDDEEIVYHFSGFNLTPLGRVVQQELQSQNNQSKLNLNA